MVTHLLWQYFFGDGPTTGPTSIYSAQRDINKIDTVTYSWDIESVEENKN